MSKKGISRWFTICGIIVLVFPILVYLVFPLSLERAMRLMHLTLPRGFDSRWWLFCSAILFCISGLLQFPFKEDEGWTCECGYNLSYINPKTKNCPECGNKVSLEWTATPGEYSRKTKKRIQYAVILFLIATILVAIAVTAHNSARNLGIQYF